MNVKTFRAPSAASTAKAVTKIAAEATTVAKEAAKIAKETKALAVDTKTAAKDAAKVTAAAKTAAKTAPKTAPKKPVVIEDRRKEAPKKEAAKKAAPKAEKEPKVIADAADITVRLAKNPPAGIGLAKRDKVIIEILQENGKAMTLAKLLKAMAKKIDTTNGRTMESVWGHHGAPAQVLRSEGIITVK